MSGFFAELKRRNVVRVGIAYLVIGWLIIEVIDTVAPRLDMPEWVPAFFIVLVLVGLPIALFFSWAYELTPQGVKKTHEVDTDASITPSTGRKLDRMIIGAMALAVAFLVYERFSPSTTAPPGPETPTAAAGIVAPAKSIAVLPFSNLSGSSETDSFVAGLHDDLLTQLSKVHDLKVISRTSVLRYAATTRSMKEIAAELGVATIMEGGVQRAGNRVRINVQLIDSATDEHLWAETYDRVLTTENVFDIQSEITRQIAAALQAALTPAEEASLAERPTDSLAAYEAYLSSKLLEERYQTTGENVLDEAIDAAKLAVELDPEFVAAWSQLSKVYLDRFWWGGRNQGDASAALAAIERARAIKPGAAEVGLMLGLYHYWVNYDYAAALPELDRVLALEPGNERARAVRGWVLRRAGRWDEALESLKKAAALNPNSRNHLISVVETLWVLYRFEEAQAWLRTADSRFPGNIVVAAQKAAITLSMTGNAEPLVEIYRTLVSQENLDPGARMVHVSVEANFGDPERALAYLESWAPDVVDVQYAFWTGDLMRAYVLFAAGRSDEAKGFAAGALPVIENAQRFEPNAPEIEKAKAYAMALMGRGDEAEAAARRVRELYPRSRDDYGAATYLLDVTEALAIAGRNALALEWLDDYLSGGGAQATLIELREWPSFAALAEAPGFAALIEKHGLVPADKSRR